MVGVMQNSATESPTANKSSLQSLRHFEQQGGVSRKQEEPPKVVALQPSSSAFRSNHPYLLSLQQQPGQ